MKIASRGGLEGPVQISSSKLAKDLHTSQQTASRRLVELEQEKLITREMRTKGQTVHITSKGKEILGGMFYELSSVFGKEPTSFTICGVITSGMGEGEYYMNMDEYANQFETNLGFRPFPGTLNLDLEGKDDILSRQRLSELPGIAIEGFKKEGRTFGSVKCFKAEIEKEKGAVVVPARTHHSNDTLEIISPHKIRKSLDVNDGDRVCVKVRIGQ